MVVVPDRPPRHLDQAPSTSTSKKFLVRKHSRRWRLVEAGPLQCPHDPGHLGPLLRHHRLADDDEVAELGGERHVERVGEVNADAASTGSTGRDPSSGSRSGASTTTAVACVDDHRRARHPRGQPVRRLGRPAVPGDRGVDRGQRPAPSRRRRSAMPLEQVVAGRRSSSVVERRPDPTARRKLSSSGSPTGSSRPSSSSATRAAASPAAGRRDGRSGRATRRCRTARRARRPSGISTHAGSTTRSRNAGEASSAKACGHASTRTSSRSLTAVSSTSVGGRSVSGSRSSTSSSQRSSASSWWSVSSGSTATSVSSTVAKTSRTPAATRVSAPHRSTRAVRDGAERRVVGDHRRPGPTGQQQLLGRHELAVVVRRAPAAQPGQLARADVRPQRPGPARPSASSSGSSASSDSSTAARSRSSSSRSRGVGRHGADREQQRVGGLGVDDPDAEPVETQRAAPRRRAARPRGRRSPAARPPAARAGRRGRRGPGRPARPRPSAA